MPEIPRNLAVFFRDAFAKAPLDPRGQMPGVRGAEIRLFLHLRLILAMEFLELGEVVEGAARDVVDEGFRRDAVVEDGLVSVRF